jgi:adenylate cyclase
MQILARGDIAQRLRLASGLVLFTFVATHLANHALGLVGIDAMLAMQDWRKAVTRSWIGSAVLLAAFVVHISLALAKIALRHTWRMPPWEALQIATGVTIPILLMPHVAFNRGAAMLAGTNDTYVYELAHIWPDFAWEMVALIVVAWAHGCIGLHHWLALKRGYARLQPFLLAIAVALPVTAVAGYTVSGREVAARVAAPGAFAKLVAESRGPDDAIVETLVQVKDSGRLAFLALLLAAIAVPVVRSVRELARPRIAISYRAGPTVHVPPGATLLEISRANGVPHASVCGGRARCSTCRVGVETGLSSLPPPGAAEAETLARVSAGPNVRLACQIRPTANLVVTRLVNPQLSALPGATSAAAEEQGVERTLAVLFLDVRGFTSLSENRLPYDVVFILNRLFAEVGEAIGAAGGHIDKYMGDGLLALFGGEDGATAVDGCRAALRAAQGIDLALERLNRDLASEIGEPLAIGIGIEVGPLVVGRIGHPETAALTVIGSTVNTAARLEALSKEKQCQVIVSEEVMVSAGLAGHALARETVMIRGIAAPREIVIVPRGRDLGVS